MTEAEWLQTVRVDRTVREFVIPRLTERKRRLFACACCRRIWHLLIPDDLRQGVELAEQFADGLLTKRALASAQRRVERLATPNDPGHFYARAVMWAIERHEQFPLCAAAYASEAVALEVTGGFKVLGYDKATEVEQAGQVVLLRDVLGNPFRPVIVDPSWLTSTVLALASQMYETRDFFPMPILADALQDAGCDSDDILNHCRDPHATQVRGCWAVDLVLGEA